MKWLLCAAVALLSALVTEPAFAADVALVGGEVHPIEGPVIPVGTVLIREERIVAVGAKVAVPSGARIIDCRGKVVTPGFIESHSQIGLVEIDLEASTDDAHPDIDDPVRAAARASDGIDLASTLVGVARRHGVTSAVSVPGDGLVSGRAAWIDLVEWGSQGAVDAIRGDVAMFASMGEAGAQAVGGSRVLAVLRLREVLEDARAFAKGRAAFLRNDMYHLSSSRLDLEALQPVVAGRMRLVIGASRASDIQTIVRLAAEERLQVAVVGAAEAWRVAAELARAKIPVIVNPSHNLPFSFESRNARSDNVALLVAAGVEVAIAARSSHNASELRFLAGNAVRAGMKKDAALRAVTLAPARIYGMDLAYGSLKAGKMANIVVWSGDPFEPSSHATSVWVRGQAQPLDSRQTQLARRHARRLGLSP